MLRGVAVLLKGAQARETGQALAERLIELGRAPERLDDAWADRLGGSRTADVVCQLLSQNGVIVLAGYEGAQPEGDCLRVDVDPNDTPDFAAEKILDSLDEAGVVDLGSDGYSSEEEAEIQKRLAGLGYVE